MAFYYPGPVWHSGENIKNLLLFFDGVGLLVPSYIRDKPERMEPYLAIPLREQGLLHILEPETFIDKETTVALSAALRGLLSSGALDGLAKHGTAFDELSRSRLGWYADPELAEMLYEELKLRGLAGESRDGLSIPMHPMVRYLILILLAQLLRPQGRRLGLELAPTTDRPEILSSLKEFLSIPSLPSSGQVVAMDLQTVGMDLRKVPLEDVLAFRRDHLRAFNAYARDVRKFVRELSLLPNAEREQALHDRQAELADRASDLRKISRSGWRHGAALGFTLAGAVWTYATGDPLGAALGAGAGLIAESSAGVNETGAYSYLVSAQVIHS